jgi:hypothetical protein
MREQTKFFASLLLTFSFLLSSVSFAFALPDEGMFPLDRVPSLPLVQKGLRIKPSEIYNPKTGGLSEAVVRLDTGCTGEFVSPQGLILTNHHCAFDALVSASTPGRNFADIGFRAGSRTEEMPAKNYSISIPKRVEDVTSRVLAGMQNLTGAEREKAVTARIAELEKQEQARAAADTTVRIQALNNGVFYYLYENQQIKDIRVVYAPPKSIGFFGGDPDNFEWSRHTGDFAFLRAYVAPDGRAAEYSTKNVPFKPRRFLPISIAGLKENDFVMVMGYPGGTTRYRESQSIEFSQNVNFPFLAEYLQALSAAYALAGETDEAKRVKFQSDIFNFDNSRKLYEGGAAALRRADFVNQRRAEETKFAAWVNANPARRAKYGEVLSGFNTISKEFYQMAERDRVLRTFPNPAFTPVMRQILDAIQANRQGAALTDEKRAAINEIYKTREPVIEREMIKFFLRQTADLPSVQRFAPVENAFARFQGRERRSAEETFAETIAEKDFTTPESIFALYTKNGMNNFQKKHPNVYAVLTALADEQAQIAARTNKFNSAANNLRMLYLEGLSEMRGVNPYPDANFTQRFTYGYVKGYRPREAVIYQPFTTLKGMIEKDTGVEPFNMPAGLKDLQRRRDFGRYGVGDSVPLNFLATTDIIGGNSGSPVLNANGEQVGIVFDGNYEGLGNDIFYNPDYGRTIAVDIRFVLFVTEKFGNAGWILNEMQIRGAQPARRPATRRAASR